VSVGMRMARATVECQERCEHLGEGEVVDPARNLGILGRYNEDHRCKRIGQKTRVHGSFCTRLSLPSSLTPRARAAGAQPPLACAA
jgi:hypothetical protein